MVTSARRRLLTESMKPARPIPVGSTSCNTLGGPVALILALLANALWQRDVPPKAVSYTHLDVYKRQLEGRTGVRPVIMACDIL